MTVPPRARDINTEKQSTIRRAATSCVCVCVCVGLHPLQCFLGVGVPDEQFVVSGWGSSSWIEVVDCAVFFWPMHDVLVTHIHVHMMDMRAHTHTYIHTSTYTRTHDFVSFLFVLVPSTFTEKHVLTHCCSWNHTPQ